MQDFRSHYRVDDVPWYWAPLMHFYGWTVGTAVFLYTGFVALTSKISYQGWPIEPGRNHIYCFWHRLVFTYHCLGIRFPKCREGA